MGFVMTSEREALLAVAEVAYEAGEFKKAFELFLSAAESGDSSAMSRIAVMCESGEGTDRDIDRSIYWDMRAIDAGSTTSLLNIGITYRRLGDIRTARHWFERSLESGDAEAALELARLYSVSEKEAETVRKYLSIVLESAYVSPDSKEVAQALLSDIADDRCDN